MERDKDVKEGDYMKKNVPKKMGIKKRIGGPCSRCGSTYYGHIGIYVGDGYFVHATGGSVQKSQLSSWANKYRGWGYCGNFTLEDDLNVIEGCQNLRRVT